MNFLILILPFISTVNFISPILSVLSINAPEFFNLSNTSSFGWPNLLFSFTPINAIFGFTASKNSCVLDVFDPWCAIFKTVEFKILIFSLYFSIIFVSAIFSISPVNRIEKSLYNSLKQIELLFNPFSSIRFKLSGHRKSKYISFSIWILIGVFPKTLTFIFFLFTISLNACRFSDSSTCFPTITFWTLSSFNTFNNPSEYDHYQSERLLNNLFF